MKNRLIVLLTLVFIIFLFLCMLLNPEKSLNYALTGLQVWFNRMIPTLFPFMIISGILVKTGYSVNIARVFGLLFEKIYTLSYDCIYIIIMGMLCGFPMGAVIIADSLKNNRITLKEAELLLSFTNNIGPVYFISFVCPICPCLPVALSVLIMYGVPLSYGVLMRYTKYRCLKKTNILIPSSTNRLLTFDIFDSVIQNAIENITKLGGYMISFNVLNLLFSLDFCVIPVKLQVLLSVLLEISGGIMKITNFESLYPLVYVILPFGGVSCYAQTSGIIRKYGLNMKMYVFHKLNQCMITFLLYTVCGAFFS